MFILDKDEVIRFEVRRHLFVLYGKLSFLLILLLVPLLMYGYLIDFLSQVSSGKPGTFFLFLYLFWVLGIWIAAFYHWTDYYLDVWIVTNQRVIDIEQKGFFHREITNFSLDRIEDITVTVSGILGTFLKFGDLHAQTAADSHDFVIRSAKNPMSVKEHLMREVRKSKTVVQPKRNR